MYLLTGIHVQGSRDAVIIAEHAVCHLAKVGGDAPGIDAEGIEARISRALRRPAGVDGLFQVLPAAIAYQHPRHVTELQAIHVDITHGIDATAEDMRGAQYRNRAGPVEPQLWPDQPGLLRSCQQEYEIHVLTAPGLELQALAQQANQPGLALFTAVQVEQCADGRSVIGLGGVVALLFE